MKPSIRIVQGNLEPDIVRHPLSREAYDLPNPRDEPSYHDRHYCTTYRTSKGVHGNGRAAFLFKPMSHQADRRHEAHRGRYL